MTFKRRFNLSCLARCPSCPELLPDRRRRLDDAVETFVEGLLEPQTLPALKPKENEEDPP